MFGIHPDRVRRKMTLRTAYLLMAGGWLMALVSSLLWRAAPVWASPLFGIIVFTVVIRMIVDMVAEPSKDACRWLSPVLSAGAGVAVLLWVFCGAWWAYPPSDYRVLGGSLAFAVAGALWAIGGLGEVLYLKGVMTKYPTVRFISRGDAEWQLNEYINEYTKVAAKYGMLVEVAVFGTYNPLSNDIKIMAGTPRKRELPLLCHELAHAKDRLFLLLCTPSCFVVMAVLLLLVPCAFAVAYGIVGLTHILLGVALPCSVWLSILKLFWGRIEVFFEGRADKNGKEILHRITSSDHELTKIGQVLDRARRDYSRRTGLGRGRRGAGDGK